MRVLFQILYKIFLKVARNQLLLLPSDIDLAATNAVPHFFDLQIHSGIPTALVSASVGAASDVFGNFPSGFRVESGDSREEEKTETAKPSTTTKRPTTIPEAKSLMWDVHHRMPAWKAEKLKDPGGETWRLGSAKED